MSLSSAILIIWVVNPTKTRSSEVQDTMERWTDAKLDKELSFALGFAQGVLSDDPATYDWLARLCDEKARRLRAQIVCLVSPSR